MAKDAKTEALNRVKTIKNAVRSYGSTMHPSKKAAPGINYKDLTPKERHYRLDNEKRTNTKLKNFHDSAYGQHLSDRARRRGEE